MTTLILLLLGAGVLFLVSAIEGTSIRQTVADVWAGNVGNVATGIATVTGVIPPATKAPAAGAATAAPAQGGTSLPVSPMTTRDYATQHWIKTRYTLGPNQRLANG